MTLDQDFPYEDSTEREKMVDDGQFILTEAEPVFDGADALRFGRDIFVTVTNVCIIIIITRQCNCQGQSPGFTKIVVGVPDFIRVT